jgi:hypothetical protein
MKPIVKSFLYLFFIMLLLLACSKKEDVGRVPQKPDNLSGFQQIGFWQKADNRLYTIYASDEDWVAMEEYADRKPYKTGKTTSVFFFNNRNGTPDVTKYQGLWSDVIDRIYADGDTTYWIARYDRFPSGEAIFKRYPAAE